MKKISIGSWAFLFNQDQPTTDFHALIHHLCDFGYDGVELGAFAPHPNPESHDTKEKRLKLKKLVQSHGLEFSALVADLWSQKLVSVDDADPFLAAFEKHLALAEDLGIATVRVDTAETMAVMRANQLDARRVMDRVTKAFDRCAKAAAARDIKVAWEFDPAFPLNKPSEILEVARRVRVDLQNANFGVLFNTAHAHLCASVGANQDGAGETLPGGEFELLQKLRDCVLHVHLIDSDGTLNEHSTSTRLPFGQGRLDFDRLVPELGCGASSDWWCVDLCFWPNAWEVAGECRRFLDKLRKKYAT